MNKIPKILILILAVFAIFSSNLFAQKRTKTKSSTANLTSGVVKTIKSGKDTIKFVKLDVATKSATVDGTTTDWEKEGTVYFTISLKKGQHLIITPDSNDISIETYTGFEPLDAVTSGSYDLEALLTTDYSFVARSKNPGLKYKISLKLK